MSESSNNIRRLVEQITPLIPGGGVGIRALVREFLSDWEGRGSGSLDLQSFDGELASDPLQGYVLWEDPRRVYLTVAWQVGGHGEPDVGVTLAEDSNSIKEHQIVALEPEGSTVIFHHHGRSYAEGVKVNSANNIGGVTAGFVISGTL